MMRLVLRLRSPSLAPRECRCLDIEVPPEMDIEELAREYESYGHEVRRDACRRWLGVLFTPSAREARPRRQWPRCWKARCLNLRRWTKSRAITRKVA